MFDGQTLKEGLETKETVQDSKLAKLKLSLENEIAEWKYKARDPHTVCDASAWLQEKHLLEKQLCIAQTQVEDNKKLLDLFKAAINKTSSSGGGEALQEQEQEHIVEANKVRRGNLQAEHVGNAREDGEEIANARMQDRTTQAFPEDGQVLDHAPMQGTPQRTHPIFSTASKFSRQKSSARISRPVPAIPHSPTRVMEPQCHSELNLP